MSGVSPLGARLDASAGFSSSIARTLSSSPVLHASRKPASTPLFMLVCPFDQLPFPASRARIDRATTRSRLDAERTRLEPERESLSRDSRLPVDVVQHRPAWPADAAPTDAGDADLRRARDRAQGEMPRIDEPRQRRSILDDRRFEQPVIELGARRQARAHAVLGAVGERDDQRGHRAALAVEIDLVVERAIAQAFADADRQVWPLAAPPARAAIELGGNVRVETNAGDVEERPIAEEPDIDGAGRGHEEMLERRARLA